MVAWTTVTAGTAVDWPDRVDPVQRIATFVPTTIDRLRTTAFLDGRTAVATGPARIVPIAELPDRPTAPVPTMLHVSFCGSTLLSRLLDVPGRILPLREPRVQVDLADWRAAMGLRPATEAFARALRGTTALLGSVTSAERVVVKPTNWANVLLADWVSDPGLINPVLLTMTPRSFVTAVFRGGRERISFTIRGASHFARRRPEGAKIIAAALAETTDPLGRAARLAVVTLGFQHAMFGEARARAGWSEPRMIDFAELRASPAATALRVARLLGLPLSADDVAANVAVMAGQDAKALDRAFTPADEQARDAEVWLHHGDRIEAALRWGERAGII